MHRRQIRTWLFSVLFFSALSVTAFAEQAIVTGEEVNVRSGPGLVYSSFTSLREGMTVEVLNLFRLSPACRGHGTCRL